MTDYLDTQRDRVDALVQKGHATYLGRDRQAWRRTIKGGSRLLLSGDLVATISSFVTRRMMAILYQSSQPLTSVEPASKAVRPIALSAPRR